MNQEEGFLKNFRRKGKLAEVPKMYSLREELLIASGRMKIDSMQKCKNGCNAPVSDRGYKMHGECKECYAKRKRAKNV